MSYYLAFDTSTSFLSVAISKNDKLLAEWNSNAKKDHSTRLMPAIERVMSEAGITSNDLAGIIVGRGPGSYTGLRIGVATAKTLAWALQIPLLGVSSLSGLAFSAAGCHKYYVPCIDARRDQVFSAVYTDKDGDWSLVIEEGLYLFGEWQKRVQQLDADVLFIGQDLDKYELRPGQIVKPQFRYTRAAALLELGLSALQAGEQTEVMTFTPEYLRIAEAEQALLDKKKISLRELCLADVPAVVEIEQAAFAMPWSKAAFERELNCNEMAHYVIAETAQGRLVGYAGIWFVIDEAHITTLAVAEDMRKQGIGEQMLVWLINRTIELGGSALTLEVRVSNQAALELYKKHGFVIRGTRKRYYSDNQEDAHVMWLTIE